MKGYKVAIDRPWDQDNPPDWSDRILKEQDAVAFVLTQAKKLKHKGSGYRLKRRGEDFGPKHQYNELDEILPRRLSRFDVGDVLILWSLKSDARWLIRKIEWEPIIDTQGNRYIDQIYSYTFQELKAPVENWGICNRRPIDNTDTWSQHSPWPPPDPGANAIDLGGDVRQINNVVNKLLANKKSAVGKIIWRGKVWTPTAGWVIVAGIGHYDHAHIEGRKKRIGEPLKNC